MNDLNCLNIEKFTFLKTHIINHGVNVALHKRLIADKKTIVTEVLFQDKIIEFAENSNSGEIIVIDKNNKIPAYFCYVKNNELKFSAYNSRFDTSNDIDVRIKDWCDIVTKISNAE